MPVAGPCGAEGERDDVRRQEKAIFFLVLTFALSWSVFIAAWMGGQREVGISSLIMLFSPAVFALVFSLVFEKGQRLKALGLRFRPNWWWLWAALIPMALTAIHIGVVALFSPHKLMSIEGMAGQFAALQHQQFADPITYLLGGAGLIALAIIPNTILFTLSEELGWRGYLYHLWRRFGFWRASLGIGLVHGVWHWPMIYLSGLNYPDHRLLGLAIFPIYTILLGVISTFVRDHGRSVWAAGILHGTVNTVTVLTVIMLDTPKFPWDAAGIGGIAALAIGALVIAMFQRRDAYRDA
jgi:hypothetical protein